MTAVWRVSARTLYWISWRHIRCDNFFHKHRFGREVSKQWNINCWNNQSQLPRNSDRESQFFEMTMEKGNVANLVRYQTKKQKSVLLLSTMHRCCAVMSNTKTKPASIEFYNRNKMWCWPAGLCGQNALNQVSNATLAMAVWCNILDLAGVNAWILFSKETGRKINRWDFIHTLALDLINPEIERRRQVERRSAGPGCNVSR